MYNFRPLFNIRNIYIMDYQARLHAVEAIRRIRDRYHVRARENRLMPATPELVAKRDTARYHAAMFDKGNLAIHQQLFCEAAGRTYTPFC